MQFRWLGERFKLAVDIQATDSDGNATGHAHCCFVPLPSPSAGCGWLSSPAEHKKLPSNETEDHWFIHPVVLSSLTGNCLRQILVQLEMLRLCASWAHALYHWAMVQFVLFRKMSWQWILQSRFDHDWNFSVNSDCLIFLLFCGMKAGSLYGLKVLHRCPCSQTVPCLSSHLT